MIDIIISNDYNPSLSYNDKNIKHLSKSVLTSENFNKATITIILSNRKYLNSLKKKYLYLN